MSRRKQLLACFDRLSPARQEALLEYAGYLRTREPEEASPPLEIVAIPRPDEENVVAAIKRLSKTYPMLSGEALLHQASSVMSEHLLHGKPAPAVIDRLEALFDARYREFLSVEKTSSD